MPILVLLNLSDNEWNQIGQLDAYRADHSFKPVTARALSAFIREHAPPAGPPPRPKIRDQSSQAQPPARPTTAPVSPSNIRPASAQQPPAGQRQDSAKPVTPAPKTDAGKPVAPPAQQKIEVKKESVPALEKTEQRAESAPAAAGIPDDLVKPTNPLPKDLPPEESLNGDVVCDHCRRWHARRDDAFCALCGGKLIDLHFEPQTIVFKPRGSHKISRLFTLKNNQQNPLRLDFQVSSPRDGESLARRFKLSHQRTVLWSGEGELVVEFDARDLDLAREYRAMIEVRSNLDQLPPPRVELKVEGRPIPQVLPQETTKPYELALDEENTWGVRIANNGSGGLTLNRVTLDGEAVGLARRVHVPPQGSELVELRIPRLEIPVGECEKKLVCEFEDCSPVSMQIKVIIRRPARLQTLPERIEFGVASNQRNHRQSLTLNNKGGEDLIVEKIETQVNWLEWMNPKPLRISPNTSQSVDFILHGSPSLEGERKGEIRIHVRTHQSRIQTVPFRAEFVKPKPYEPYIGIDFGTTASCVAALDENEHPIALEIETGRPETDGDLRIMPSVLYFVDEKTILAGREARAHASANPDLAVQAIKRVLGKREGYSIHGRPYTPVELTAEVIRELLRRAERDLFTKDWTDGYRTPRQAVLTVPVGFSRNERLALLRACEQAGLDVRKQLEENLVINEAHAAALCYLSQGCSRIGHGGETLERLFVFDFGGGSLDCELLQLERSETGKLICQTLMPGGNPDLGGEDIDWALVRLLGGRITTTMKDFDDRCLHESDAHLKRFYQARLLDAAIKTRQAFKFEAEQAKIALGENERVELTIKPLLSKSAAKGPYHLKDGAADAVFRTILTRNEMEEAIKPLLDDAVRTAQVVCERAKVAPQEVHTILHVGRTSYLQQVKSRINQLFPNAEDHSDLVPRKLCVALGAAFWGRIKDQEGDDFKLITFANRLTHPIGNLKTDSVTFKRNLDVIFDSGTVFPTETVRLMKRGNNPEIVLSLAEDRGSGAPKLLRKITVDLSQMTELEVPATFSLTEDRRLIITVNQKQVAEIDLLVE
ncbi:MAG: Hsp70 family protein [Blastocatellia bacterium]